MKRPYLPCRAGYCRLVALSVLFYSALAVGQLAVNPSSISFGSIPTGTSTSQSLILRNSGSSSIRISQATLTGTGFSQATPSLPFTLSAGQSTSFKITFASRIGGSFSGAVSVSWATLQHSNKRNRTSTNNTMVSLSAAAATVTLTPSTSSPQPAPGQLVASPGSVSFGSVQVGKVQNLTAVITNAGGSSVALSQAMATGTGFSISGLTAPTTLAVGESMTFNVAFAPTSAGNVTGTVSVSSDAANSTLAIGLVGAGMAQGQLTATPATADFGAVTVGTSKSQSGTLTASGSSVSISSINLSSTEFSLSGITLPLTLAAGQSVPFTLTFKPQASGSVSATGTFASNASNVAFENLTGTGTAPPQHVVELTWSDVSTVVGYNVYRGAQLAGPYTKINSSLNATAAYSDNSVQAGQTYYYVTTAVNASGTESAYSTSVTAVVPTP